MCTKFSPKWEESFIRSEGWKNIIKKKQITHEPHNYCISKLVSEDYAVVYLVKLSTRKPHEFLKIDLWDNMLEIVSHSKIGLGMRNVL